MPAQRRRMQVSRADNSANEDALVIFTGSDDDNMDLEASPPPLPPEREDKGASTSVVPQIASSNADAPCGHTAVGSWCDGDATLLPSFLREAQASCAGNASTEHSSKLGSRGHHLAATAERLPADITNGRDQPSMPPLPPSSVAECSDEGSVPPLPPPLPPAGVELR